MREKHLIEKGLADLAFRAEADHEVQMARADLYKLAKYAIKLHEMLKGVSEQEGLDGWVQAKITKAADYISSVYHHLDYETKFDEVTESNQKLDEDLGKAVNHLMAATGEISKSIAGGAIHGTAYGIGAASQAPKALKKSFQKGKAAGKKALGDSVEEAVCTECGKPRFVALPEEMQAQYETVNEEKQKGVDGKVCWKGYKRMGTKMKGGKRVDNCVKVNDSYEADLSARLSETLSKKKTDERTLTKGEEKKKEKYVKGMKKAKSDFKDRYGDDAKAVMYATATKMAKKK